MRPIRPGQPGYSPFVAPMAPMGTGVEPLQVPAPQPKKAGGMFGNDKFGWKQALAFGLAGFASRQNPAILQGLMGAMMQKQKAQQEAEQSAAQQEAQKAWWYEQQKYTAANSREKPHYFEDNSGNLMAVVDGQPRMVHKDPNPWKLVPNGLGGVIPVNMQQLMGGQQPEILDSLPEGAKPIGGPTPPASDNFLGSR